MSPPPPPPSPDTAAVGGLFKQFGGLRLQALTAVALKAGGAAAALLLQWLIARIYGAEGTGLFALMATTATFIGIMAVGGQDYIALRHVAGDLAQGDSGSARANASASIRIALWGTVVGTAAMAVTALAYGRGVQPELMPILLLALPVVAGLALGRVFAFTARAGGRVIASQLPDGPITSAVAVSGLLLAAIIGRTPPQWTLGAVYGAAYAAALAFSWWLYRGVRRWWDGGAAPKPLKPIVLAGLPLVVGSASPYLGEWLIILTATSLFSSEVAGQIRIVTLILSVMYLVTVAFDAVVAPQMAQAVRLGERNRLARLYRAYALGSLALNLPLLLGALLAPRLLLSVFGPQFTDAADALRIAAAVQAVTIAMGPAGLVLVMAHRERMVLWVNAVGLLVLILGCTIVIPTYGVLGGALVSASVLFSKRLAEIVFLRRGAWPAPTPV